jgi:putative NADPH-quinone reductase
MNALVIVSQRKRPSFNSAIADAVLTALQAHGYDTTHLIDLYADNFDPVMPLAELSRKFSFDEQTLRYQEKIQLAQRIVIVHPDWWGSPPAILKGFLDRVLRPGVAYGFREADFRNEDAPGLFADKRFDIFITTDAKAPQHAERWTPSRVWKENVLEFCGVTQSEIHVFWNLRKSTYAERKAWLENIGVKLGLIHPTRAPD